MRRIGYIVAIVAMMFVAACNEIPESTIENYLKPDITSKQLEATKGSFFLGVESNVEWTITSSDAWLTANKSEGEGNANVIFSYSANEQSKSRSAIVTLEAKVADSAPRHEILIYQKAQSGGNNDGGNGSGGNDDGGSDDGGNTSGGNTGSGITSDTHTGWAELPAIVDANSDGIHDNNSTLYYASHLCAGGEKNAQETGTARNFTVCFSAEHHVPMWVAAPRHKCYESGAKRTDAYAKDPKIPADIQYNSKSTGGGCNKGHMLGSAERLSSTATNKQAFYYTNIAPQFSSGYNTGGGGWNTLEDWVDGQSCADTLYQVIGCYFDRYTDGYGYTVSPKKISFGGRDDVSLPTMFYCVLLRTKSGSSGKSVFECSEGELKCAAFVRSHTNDLKGQKVTSKEMMSVADLEKLTGFTFFVNVPNAPKDVCIASEWGL